MTFVVTEGCIDVKDKACLEECPVDCLYEGERMMYIHPVECIDCGACLIACPQEAIIASFEVTEESQRFADAAREVFVRVGSPGGADTVDGFVPDGECIARLPRRKDSTKHRG
jgi:NAD-dependent dihydropyrimidine dehydrogenase PreA subunit